MLALDLLLEVGAKLGVQLGAHLLDDRRSGRLTVGPKPAESGSNQNREE
jgi:hypothetical protein